MLRHLSVGIFGLVLVFVLVQTLVGGKYDPPYWGFLWLLLAVVPAVYLALTEKFRLRGGFFFAYALLLVITILGQGLTLRTQGMGATDYLKTSFLWLVVAQGLLFAIGRRGRPQASVKRPAPLDQEVIKTIQEDLIPEDLTEDALKLLAQQPGLLPEERKSLSLIQSRNAALRQQIIKNLIEPTAAGRERAKINEALLTLLQELEE